MGGPTVAMSPLPAADLQTGGGNGYCATGPANAAGVPVTFILWRCAEALAATPGLLLRARTRARAALDAFHRVLAPILAETIIDAETRAWVHASLRAWSVKGSHIIGSYARMAGVPDPVELAALASAFARLYDDLLDQERRPGFAAQAAAIFSGQEIDPADDYDRLLETLFQETSRRLGRPPGDPLFAAFSALHEYQIRSLAQRGDGLTLTELSDITWGKGAFSLMVLFCLARAGMPAAEQHLTARLGAALQLLDDYQDAPVDRARGISTLATRRETTLGDIAGRIAQLEPGIRAFYGDTRARPFLHEIYLSLVIAVVARHRARLLALTRSWRSHQPRSPRWAAKPARPRSALAVLIARGPDTVASGRASE